MEAPIAGICSRQFDLVRREFARNFCERGEVGAAITVVVDGQVVVDLVGGWTDAGRTREWDQSTMVNFYSAGKPILATLLLQLVDAGLTGLDDPVASIWPEFSQRGKAGATVRHALCHRAGVPAISEDLTNDDLWEWTTMTRALAATAPWFEPGSRHVYHTNTYGHLVGEMVRRVAGAMPGDQLRSLARGLHADLCFGVPDEDLERCANVIMETASSPAALAPENGDDESSMIMRGYFNPPGYSSFGVVNSRQWRQAQVPSTNGHGTANGLARFYAALLEPGRVLSPSLLAEATRVQSEGFCPVLGEETTFALGFQPTNPRRPFGPHEGSFGHFGTGGAVGFADPTRGLAFGYVMNHVIPRWQSTRNRALIDAVYQGR